MNRYQRSIPVARLQSLQPRTKAGDRR